ncbi:hypothetical protein DYQ86_21975 [Acidobacteria bacterium AB60]|nr:hypothetical protein DYQ86_21975 [Acidobacteria bacterium AB60]
MFERRNIQCMLGVLGVVLTLEPFAFGAPRKVHAVALGTPKKVAYSKTGDPAGALPGEEALKIRPLVIDGAVKEWTTGEAHDVTERSFVVRRALRVNDELPGEKLGTTGAHWVWQRGPWLLVDRTAGHVTALKLPDYDPGVSQVVWFRDYGAYCGITASGKSLYAVVAQLALRKPVLAKRLGKFDPESRGNPEPACGVTEWQRDPLRVLFRPAGREPAAFDVLPGSAMLVEDSDEQSAASPAAGKSED